MKRFDEDGLSFDYQDDWVLEREPTSEGWTVTVQSPGDAFAAISLVREMTRTVEEVAAAALKALKEEYPVLDATAAIETLAGEVAVGHDVEFISLDLTAACWTRCFYGSAGTVLVLCQVSSLDEAEYEPALRALRASMRSEE